MQSSIRNGPLPAWQLIYQPEVSRRADFISFSATSEQQPARFT